jgi:hypothetical protein
MNEYLIERLNWNAQDLVANYPPTFHHPNKQFLYELAFSKNPQASGSVGYSRWNPRPLPEQFEALRNGVSVSGIPGYFDYQPTGGAEYADWHLNFASACAFSTWATSLFAQDEIQVAEHPVLMAVSQASRKAPFSMVCCENESRPTPVLISGVERRLSIDTSPNPAQERPYGLYGVSFKRATYEELEAATTVFDNPATSNLLAIEAPAYGSGCYTEEVVTFVLSTAYSGFAAAKVESLSRLGSDKTHIHTGFWGCGAYGGNRIVMTILQIAAAELAAINKITFHTGDDSGQAALQAAVETYQFLRAYKNGSLNDFISRIVNCCYEWGESDGN